MRRGVLHRGLLLYQSRGLVERRFDQSGVFFTATEHSAAFLDALRAEYALHLRQRARWLLEKCGALTDAQLEELVRENIGQWGTEFEMESVLWEEETA